MKYGAERDLEDTTNKGQKTLTIFEAADTGDVDAIKKLSKEGVDVNLANEKGFAPLIIAARKGHSKAIKALIKAGAKVNGDANGSTALMFSAKGGHVEALKVLVGLGAKIEARNKLGNTPLIVAAIYSQVEALKVLVKLGAEIEAVNNDGFNALILAAAIGHVEVIELLHKLGADIHAVNNVGDTAVIVAANFGKVEAIKVLHRLGASIEAVNNDGCNALILAASIGHVEVIKLLHKLGAYIHVVTNDGYNALIVAAANGRVEAIKVLVGLGAKIEAVSNDGCNALILAAGNGHVEVIKLLHKLGADIHAVSNDGYGYNALILAAGIGQVEAIKVLIELGAKFETQLPKDGRTVLHVAANRTALDPIQVLALECNNGRNRYVPAAKIDSAVIPNKDGQTPLQALRATPGLLKNLWISRQQQLKDNGLYRLCYQLLSENPAPVDLTKPKAEIEKEQKCNAIFKQGLDILFRPDMLPELKRQILNYCTGPLTYSEEEDRKAETVFREVYAPMFNLNVKASNDMKDKMDVDTNKQLNPIQLK